MSPHPLGPGGVPEGSRYARKRPPQDDDDHAPAPAPPSDPGEEALRGQAGCLLALAFFGPLIASTLTLEALHGRPGPWPILRFLGVVALSGLLVAHLHALGRRRPWARPVHLLLCALPLPGVAVAWWGGLLAPWFAAVLTAGTLALVGAQARLFSRPEVRALFARPPADDVAREGLWPAWGWLCGFLGLVVVLDGLQLSLRAQLGGGLLQGLGGLGILLGAVAGAATIVSALALARHRQGQERRERAQEAPRVRSRIVALRAEGRSLRQIAHALDEEGLSPGVRWSGRALRDVLRAERAARARGPERSAKDRRAERPRERGA